MHAPALKEQFSLHPFDHGKDRYPAELDRSIEPDSALMSKPPADPAPTAASRFARMMMRQRLTILVALFLCLAAAAIAINRITPVYTATAQLMIQRVSAGSAPSADDRLRALRNEQDLIVSTPVLASALASPGVHEITPLRGHPDALKLIKQQIRVDSGKGDDLINLSFDAADPNEATHLIAAVVASYVRFRSGLHETQIDGSAATVLAEKQRASQTLAQKRAQLQQLATAQGLAQGDEQVEAADEVLHELGIRLAQARVDLVAARSAYDQMQNDLAEDPRLRDQLAQSKNIDSSLASGDDQAIARQICTLQSQLAGYGNKFMVNYAPVQLLHHKIDDLKFTRDAIIQQRWQTALRCEAELQTSFEQQQTVVAASAANRQAFEDRKADVRAAEKQLALLDKQQQDLESASKLITTMVTVIEPATATDMPAKPHAIAILILAVSVGLSLGAGIAAVRDARSENANIGTASLLGPGLPLLARLPAVPRMQLSMNSWRDRMVDSAAEFAGACASITAALENVGSFSGGRTVLIASTNANEGKSTLASLLALTLAQTDKRVLLVDANLASPVQGSIFDIDGEYGLGQLLEDGIEAGFASFVHPGSDPRMDVLLAGSSTVPFDDLLNSQHLTNLMAAMAAEYDYVLVDSPALSTGTEARIIASACDATIVLANERGINRKVLLKTRDSLTSVGGHVLGVVLNAGTPAVAQQRKMVNIDVSHQKAIPEPAAAPAPMQVTTVRLSPPTEPPQAVVAAQVHRAAANEPEASLMEPDQSPGQWIWSYLLCLALLAGGWMAFSGMWGSSQSAAAIAKAARPAPSDPAAILQQEPVAIIMAGAGLIVAMLLAAFHAKPTRHELAVIIAAALLAAYSLHGGAINTLWRSQQHDFLPSSAAQSVLLFASLAFAWALLRRFNNNHSDDETQPDSITDIAIAGFATASAMSAMMILLSHWQTKGECLAVIAFSSCLSAMAAYWMAPLRSSLTFWLSPLTVALFGYACAAMNAHGIHVGMLLSLARPLPMDYASMGPMGAVLGFWIARSAGRFSLPMATAVG